ncbi:hypothetical protein [Candidatus Mycolicibacterium alkanivorans]|uniref:Uncharacterized protein n=1 Tax=Candidatus Mycolicibacterium alkanivorans TaxID=2954114 RepID=A0ABS9YRQ7_9MYCO|nr:hypothetical protein [Candidatus Mycolicibacterium alkanivorans]MCI4673915.1 hypothetical protein [Candidatus Mycolicibacterium alkanivorans]
MNLSATSATVTILAHGGQMTSDEIAIVGSGIGLAVLFPAAVLLFVIRKSNRGGGSDTSNDEDAEFRTLLVADVSTDSATNLDAAGSKAHFDPWASKEEL